MQMFLPLTLIAVSSALTLLQGFPFEIFKPRTLKDVIAITTKSIRPDDSMFLAHN